MSDDQKNDKGERGVLEDSGITEEKEKRLTLEAEKLIRQYMIKCVSLPALIVGVVLFLLGFFLNNVAFQTGSNQAFLSAQSDVRKLTREVMAAKFKADSAVQAIETSSKEVKKSEGEVRRFARELSSLESKLESTAAFRASDPQIKKIADILVKDPRIERILAGLERSIQVRLQNADEEIEKIKSAYKFEFCEDKIKNLMNYEKTFSFPFPVKHVWLDLPQSSEEPYEFSVVAINGSNVTVKTMVTTPVYVPSAERILRWLNHPVQLKVWATSF